MSFPLALSFLQNLVVVLFVLVCLAIVLIVLLQKGRGGGIGGAFGGGGGAGSLLGTKTGDFLTWVTICLIAAFLVLAVLMGKFLRPGTPDLALPAAPVTAPAESATEAPTMPEATTPADEQAPAAAQEPAEAAGNTAAPTEMPAEPTN